MELLFECMCQARLKPPVLVGPGPFGVRMFFEVSEGKLEGQRVSGRVLPGGGDWLLVGTDGWGHMDVRAQFETNDQAVIYAQFRGVIQMNEAVTKAIADGEETQFEDQYFRMVPWLETGDPRYSWMNRTAFVGMGRFMPGLAIEYQLYRVT